MQHASRFSDGQEDLACFSHCEVRVLRGNRELRPLFAKPLQRNAKPVCLLNDPLHFLSGLSGIAARNDVDPRLRALKLRAGLNDSVDALDRSVKAEVGVDERKQFTAHALIQRQRAPRVSE